MTSAWLLSAVTGAWLVLGRAALLSEGEACEGLVVLVTGRARVCVELEPEGSEREGEGGEEVEGEGREQGGEQVMLAQLCGVETMGLIDWLNGLVACGRSACPLTPCHSLPVTHPPASTSRHLATHAAAARTRVDPSPSPERRLQSRLQTPLLSSPSVPGAAGTALGEAAAAVEAAEAGAAAVVRARHGASVIAVEGCSLLRLGGASLLRHLPRAVLGVMAATARERGIVRDALVQEAGRQRLEQRRRLALQASYAASMELLSASMDGGAAAAAPRPPATKADALSRRSGAAAASATATGGAMRASSPTARRAMARRALPMEGQPAPPPSSLPSSLPSSEPFSLPPSALGGGQGRVLLGGGGQGADLDAAPPATASTAASTAYAYAASAYASTASAYGMPLVRCATAPYAAHGKDLSVASPGTPLRRSGMGAPPSLAPEQLRRHNSLRRLRTASLSAPRLLPAETLSPLAAPAPAACPETPPPPSGPPLAPHLSSRDTAVWSSRVSTPAGARGGASFGGRSKQGGKGASAGTLRCWNAAALDAEEGGLDLVGLEEVRRLLLQLEESDTTAKQTLKAQEQASRRPRFEDEGLGSGMA